MKKTYKFVNPETVNPVAGDRVILTRINNGVMERVQIGAAVRVLTDKDGYPVFVETANSIYSLDNERNNPETERQEFLGARLEGLFSGIPGR